MRKTFVVYDSALPESIISDCINRLTTPGPQPLGPVMIPIVADEAHKTLQTVEQICRELIDGGADRSSLVVALGGGVTSDIAGFAASICKRGIPYANIPTTLLAMVDAGIGGKTGVNLGGLKNMLGVVRQPEYTEIRPEYLQTLPRREWLSGSAEMLKTFVIASPDLYERAVSLLSQANTPLQPGEEPSKALLEDIEPLITAAGDIKRKIVATDPYDNGPRRVLNLGHTWAHAIEWWQNTQPAPETHPAGTAETASATLSHGEAVAIGIIQAAKMSAEKGLCDPSLPTKLKADFAACGLPTDLPCPEAELQAAMTKDKKRSGSKPNYVLLKDIGDVII